MLGGYALNSKTNRAATKLIPAMYQTRNPVGRRALVAASNEGRPPAIFARKAGMLPRTADTAISNRAALNISDNEGMKYPFSTLTPSSASKWRHYIEYAALAGRSPTRISLAYQCIGLARRALQRRTACFTRPKQTRKVTPALGRRNFRVLWPRAAAIRVAAPRRNPHPDLSLPPAATGSSSSRSPKGRGSWRPRCRSVPSVPG